MSDIGTRQPKPLHPPENPSNRGNRKDQREHRCYGFVWYIAGYFTALLTPLLWERIA